MKKEIITSVAASILTALIFWLVSFVRPEAIAGILGLTTNAEFKTTVERVDKLEDRLNSLDSKVITESDVYSLINDSNNRKISTQKIELVDVSGNVTGSLSNISHGPELFFINASGKKALSLRIDSNEAGVLVLTDKRMENENSIGPYSTNR